MGQGKQARYNMFAADHLQAGGRGSGWGGAKKQNLIMCMRSTYRQGEGGMGGAGQASKIRKLIKQRNHERS